MITRYSFFVSLLLLVCCNINPNQTWKNDSIDSNLKSKIHHLNQQVVNAFKNNRPQQLLAITGKVMFEYTNREELIKIVETISQNNIQKEFKIIDEYYVLNTSKGGNNILIGEDYKIVYQALNKEMYTTLLEVAINPYESILLTIIYGKYEENWKINLIRYGNYSYYGKNAIDFYRKGQQLYKKGYLIDAFKNLHIAKRISEPIIDIGRYNIKKDIDELLTKIEQEIYQNHSFPLEIATISSKPTILSINPNLSEEGLILDFQYHSTINQSDTIALEKEYLAIVDVVGKEYKGVLTENNLLVFNALEQVPDGENPVKVYQFLHEVK